MKKIFLLAFVLLMIGNTFALESCSDTNEIDISNIPCNALTVPITCSGNVTILNTSNADINYTASTSIFSSLIYNFTVNLTEGSYEFIDCANNTATVLVGDFPRDDLWRASVMIGLLGIAFVLLTMAKKSFDKDRWLIKTFFYICSGLMVLICIQTGLIFARVPGIETMMFTSMVIIISALSIFFLYILIYYTIGIIKSIKNKDKEEF